MTFRCVTVAPYFIGILTHGEMERLSMRYARFKQKCVFFCVMWMAINQ